MSVLLCAEKSRFWQGTTLPETGLFRTQQHRHTVSKLKGTLRHGRYTHAQHATAASAGLQPLPPLKADRERVGHSPALPSVSFRSRSLYAFAAHVTAAGAPAATYPIPSTTALCSPAPTCAQFFWLPLVLLCSCLSPALCCSPAPTCAQFFWLPLVLLCSCLSPALCCSPAPTCDE